MVIHFARMTRDLTGTHILRLKQLWDEFINNDKTLRNSHNVDFYHDYFSRNALYNKQEHFDDFHDL